jgi:predicted HTH transcriptional regulator
MPKGLYERLQKEIDARDKREGFALADLLDLPDDLRGLMQRVVRRGSVSATELAPELQISAEAIGAMLETLVEKGYLERVSETTPARYKAALARKRARQLPGGIWDALSGKMDKE